MPTAKHTVPRTSIVARNFARYVRRARDCSGGPSDESAVSGPPASSASSAGDSSLNPCLARRGAPRALLPFGAMAHPHRATRRARSARRFGLRGPLRGPFSSALRRLCGSPDCSAIIRFISSSYHLRLIDTSREPTFALHGQLQFGARSADRTETRGYTQSRATRSTDCAPPPNECATPLSRAPKHRRFASIARRTYSLSPTPALCARRAVAPRRELPDAAAPRLTCGGRPPRHQRDGAPSDGRPTGSPGNCTCLRGPTAGCAAACRPSPTSRAS